MKYRVKWCFSSVPNDYPTLKEAKAAVNGCPSCKIVRVKTGNDIRAEERERIAKALEEYGFHAVPHFVRTGEWLQ